MAATLARSAHRVYPVGGPPRSSLPVCSLATRHSFTLLAPSLEGSFEGSLATALTPFLATDPKNRPLSPIIATLPEMPSCKPFVCHTCDALPPGSDLAATIYPLPTFCSLGHSGQQLPGLVPHFRSSRTLRVGGYLAESKRLKRRTRKKLRVWTPACAPIRAFGPSSESHYIHRRVSNLDPRGKYADETLCDVVGGVGGSLRPIDSSFVGGRHPLGARPFTKCR